MKKDIFANAVPSGIASFVLSFLACTYIIPFPATPLANAINNGISGFMSAAVSVVVTTIILYKKYKQNH